MEKSKFNYGEKDLLPEKIDPRDVTVQISIKMEGDLLDALKARAAELSRPYQTLMKEMLREKLELPEERDLAGRVEQLEGDIRELASSYRKLLNNRKKLDVSSEKHSRARSRTKRTG